ncbi:Two component system response regulator/histidine kinase [Desulfonema limicola]|uniref:histidine kinase n=1 Tax=Desulfonema limicola TaxID=45656 RepID=A0A975BCJ7_9BACT|nr:response regulator [Desulfonema limicola]QTA82972.1 Two component system response regulator/histidine kinase [Desulfonema limicola]
MSHKNKILIVDDSKSIVAAIVDILQDDFELKTAYSGEEALEVIKDFKPDLLLLDVVMTGISGYEVCRKIRSEGSYGYTKIIMISSKTMLEELLKGYEAGADDYIGKPFKEEELLAKVRVFMRLKSVEDELKRVNSILDEQVRVRTKQLLDAEKMAVIGRYAAGIVHNLNNPLQAIMGNAELLSIKHPDNQNIMNLRKAAAQMKKIISSILSTSYKESGTDYTFINLNEILIDQIELFKANPFFKHKINIQMDLNDLPAYGGIYHHFSQSFGNFIKNAVDAMYKSSIRILSVSTSVVNEYIIIKISDTGHGIAPSKMDKIFNPFFTTKPLSASDDRPTGTGLGLASAKEMIGSYGGDILVQSEVDKGTTLTVKLPYNKP